MPIVTGTFFFSGKILFGGRHYTKDLVKIRITQLYIWPFITKELANLETVRPEGPVVCWSNIKVTSGVDRTRSTYKVSEEDKPRMCSTPVLSFQLLLENIQETSIVTRAWHHSVT